ncbi:SDR family oxidoreductase [Leekyejoonella antrihumi]|uniref:NAD-dependent epimerase/dehydratase family protein n=1 Tax=Leekyejoonella antrihumi TaxID=1660198 RepID=A0A563DYL5_9MICO|nr:NAD(P)H-binding protein [Leekyejoonella antrihumi]TWP35091.1 NAD-dependent epimerase/dehydratase family protein [Leekyejoonella antrihumi]
MAGPTDPPPLVPGLPGLGRAPVLVTGGTGTLGLRVVEELTRSEVPARVLTRRASGSSPVPQVEGDLATGDGLLEAVSGVQAIIHCASNPTHAQQVDVQGTRRLCDVLSQANPDARLVYVSIVGCWDSPMSYYQVKADTEAVVTGSGRPHVIVRATQFHDLVARICGAHLGPVGLGLSGLRFASCDTAWVAARLVDVALDETPATAPIELAGPETQSARDLAVLTAHIQGRRTPRVLPLPAVGGALKAFAAGANLPGPGAVRGGRTYAEWLAARPN